MLEERRPGLDHSLPKKRDAEGLLLLLYQSRDRAPPRPRRSDIRKPILLASHERQPELCERDLKQASCACGHVGAEPPCVRLEHEIGGAQPRLDAALERAVDHELD